METPRGKCPSLITGSHGRPKFEVAKGKRTCKRCKSSIIRGTACVSIPVPGRMGSKTYCCTCLGHIIEKSRKDLTDIEAELSAQTN
jgi:hypothetical protein